MFFYICLHFYAESSIKQKKNQNKPHLMHSDGPQKHFFTVSYLWNQERYLSEIFRNYSGGYNQSLEQIKLSPGTYL